MNLRAVKVIWLRELKVHIRDRARVISGIARSILWMVVFGAGFGAARFTGLEVNYQEFLFPGVVAMSLLFTSMQSGISVIWDKEFGFLKEILVSPASRFSIMAGKLIGGATIAVMEGAIVLLMGPFIGVKLTVAKFLLCVALMFLSSLSLVGIGLIIASVMKSFEGFQVIMTFFIMPMFFLSGAIFPIDKIPKWMAPLTAIDPLTYGVDALRTVLIGVGYHQLGVDIAVMAAAAVVAAIIGTRAFRLGE
ncbi:MAG: ABC transporter permease [Candidatus Altiarchaeota archaeon]